MRVYVTAKPRAKRKGLEKIDETHFAVAVKEPARDGRANAAIAKALAKHFNVSPSRVRLVSGLSSRRKLFEIL